MSEKLVTLKENNKVEPCPKCGNNTKFKALSQQVQEDCCDVWIECICGFDPTLGKFGSRFEDTWGRLDESTILTAIDIWNDEIVESKENA